MNGRRRKDEPFNPFAPNASQKSRERKERTQRPTPRPKTPEPVKQTDDHAAKQRAAVEALKRKKELEEKKTAEKVAQNVAPVVRKNPSPQPKPAPKTSITKPDSREERLAALRAKSAATAQFAKDAKDAKKVGTTEELVAEVEILETATVVEEVVAPVAVVTPDVVVESTSSNVFKTIKTEKKKVDRRPKRRRGDKKGGGRQPTSRKLDRRKYLEYKYVARELLENDAISEEHRSNVLGQIWAKGERIGVSEAIEFITQKEEELILPAEVADEFRKIVKRYTTKR